MELPQGLGVAPGLWGCPRALGLGLWGCPRVLGLPLGLWGCPLGKGVTPRQRVAPTLLSPFNTFGPFWAPEPFGPKGSRRPKSDF